MSLKPPRATTSDEGSVEFWRARALQLQHALDSRVVVEQAKGMLAERFRVAPDVAFAILRRAARSNSLSVHELAAAVLVTPDTPRMVSDVLGRGLDGHRDGAGTPS